MVDRMIGEGTRRATNAAAARHRTHRRLAVLGVGVAILAACSTAGGSASPSEATRIRVAGTVGAGFTEVQIAAAVETLRAQGYDAEEIDTADPAINIEGLANGQFDITTGDTGATLIAIQTTDAPISAIAAGPANAWTVYSTDDITSCAELQGRKVAIHNQVSDSTAMLTNWINSECPGTEPEFIVIAGSGNRLAALLAGEVEATPLELSDAIVLEEEPGGGYTLLASFATDLPNLRPNWAVANDQFLADHPEAVQAFLAAVTDEFRKSNDPEYLRQIIDEHGPELAELPAFDTALQRYTELGIFDVNYGVEMEMFEYTIAFYEEAGSIQPGLTTADVVNLAPLEAALDEIGRQ
jgi:NitT/TauT family transport system substrate-binding protein